jgi:hypothetical protein
MKSLTVCTLCVLFCLNLSAQSFSGYRSGNYTGVNSAFFNPANIADSRYQWNVNLLGINAGIGNTNTSFSLKDINKTFDGDADSLLFGNSGKDVNGAINIDFWGPSFMFNINRKTSIAFTSRLRAMANVTDVDGKLIQSINDDVDGGLPYSLNTNNNQKISINGWADFGVTVGRVILSQGVHFLKGGLTLKYLAGTGNSYININKLNATINQDGTDAPYLTNASGSVGIGYAGIDFDNFEADNAFRFNGRGFGADIGLVYEFRPDASQFDESQNKYKLKFGIALLDMGSIKYTPKADEFGNYDMHVSNTEKWYPDDIDGSIAEIKEYLDGSPYFTKKDAGITSYKVSLPTNLQMNIDYAVTSKLYIEAAAQINLTQKSNRYNSFYYNSFSLTPRFEGRHIGVYFPLSYNELTHFNAGVAFRLGPFYIGSGSVLTALLGNSKQADVHFGINFGGLYKKERSKERE